ncbi:MAG: LPS-assembly protein LptD, partial [Fuerstiella sp.]|nr:LPS-assembly protein LptD [Fuerstiella sp.]
MTGPILLVDTDGTILAAESAELSSDLRDGILRSARMVLDQRLQIAAQEIHRVDERYIQALRTVSSACQVCDDDPTPLWQIRATRIIHDKDEQQLYYENAVLDIAGWPVAYVPRLRLPDGSLRRATGFLMPVYTVSDRIGTQITLPYFIRLGDTSDLTFSPSFTNNGSFTFGGQYRQAFSFGEVQLDFAY